MKDIHLTRKATHSISLSIKFFLLKKKYYLTMLKIRPEIYGSSTFIQLLKNKPSELAVAEWDKRSNNLGLFQERGGGSRRYVELE